MKNHDPREQVRGIHQILTSDKKRVGFLFGAGTSFATGLDGISVPAIAKMTSDIVQHVSTQSTALASAIDDIKIELTGENIAFNIESLLTRIESKRAVIGAGTLNGLDSSGFADLAKLVKEQVVKLVSIHDRLDATEDRKNCRIPSFPTGFKKLGAGFLRKSSQLTMTISLKSLWRAQGYRTSTAFQVGSSRSFVQRLLKTLRHTHISLSFGKCTAR